MSFAFDLAQQGDNALMEQAANSPLDVSQLTPKTGMLGALPRGALAGAVRLASGLDLAASVVPIAIDAVTGSTKLEDQYFAEHDATFGRAQKILTPTPEATTTAGRIAFGVTQGLTELLGGGAGGLVASEEINTGADMVGQGVDTSTALLLGDVAGITNAVGAGIPAAFGKTLMARLLSGAAGNMVAGATGEAAQKGMLQANGYGAMADQINPLDAKARLVDLVMGAAFGGLHHLQVHSADVPAARDAAATLNLAAQAEASTPGEPATAGDFAAHLDAHQKAQDDLQNDRPVDVSAQLDGAKFEPSPRQEAVRQQVQTAADAVTAEVKTADPEAFLTPEQVTSQEHEALVRDQLKMTGIKASEKQIKALVAGTDAGPMRDEVTGLYEARVSLGGKNSRIEAIKRLQKVVSETGADAAYIHSDVQNLGGLNKHLTEVGANDVFRMFSRFLDEEAQKIPNGRAISFRHGGDEISAVVLNATTEMARKAMQIATRRAREYAAGITTPGGDNLMTIPHAKTPEIAAKRGTGLTFGVSQVVAGKSPSDIIHEAAHSMEVNKDVRREQTPGAGAGGPDAGGGAGKKPGLSGQDGGRGQGVAGAARQDVPERNTALPAGADAETVAAAEQAVAADPTVPAIDESTGQHVPAGELLAKIDTEIQDAEKKRNVFSAAIACFLRNGGL